MPTIRHRSSNVLVALGAVCLLFGVGASGVAAAEDDVAAVEETASAEPETVEAASDVTAAAFVATVTPTVGLSDGDSVTVTFSGAGTPYPVSAFLCSQETAGGASATFVCDVANAASQTAMGPSGTITITNVHDGNVGSTGTCTKTCKIMVADNSTATMKWTDITFGQPDPPPTTTTTQATTTTTTGESTTSTTVSGSTSTTAATTATTAAARVRGAEVGRSLAATGAGTGLLAVLAGLFLLAGAVLVRSAERRKAPSRS